MKLEKKNQKEFQEKNNMKLGEYKTKIIQYEK